MIEHTPSLQTNLSEFYPRELVAELWFMKKTRHPMVVRRAPRTGCSMLNVGCWVFPIPSIPTGLHPSAQGWPRQRTTLGQPSKIFFNPNGGCILAPPFDAIHSGLLPFIAATQGSSFLATLG
jgi:hypothetical protein